MQRIHLQECLHWCDDLIAERRACLAQSCQEVLWINQQDLGLFVCKRNGKLCVFVRNGSQLPALRQTA